MEGGKEGRRGGVEEGGGILVSVGELPLFIRYYCIFLFLACCIKREGQKRGVSEQKEVFNLTTLGSKGLDIIQRSTPICKN